MKPDQIALGYMIEGLTEADYTTACKILGDDPLRAPRIWNPDIVIAPDGNPYLYRWYLVGGSSTLGQDIGATVMFHIQVASDPERPLHDHPWDNQSVILAGTYLELLQSDPPYGKVAQELRKPGEVITRAAAEAHRLILPKGIPYAMTLFSTGPKVRTWGFWYGDQWRSYKEHVHTENGVSIHVNREMAS